MMMSVLRFTLEKLAKLSFQKISLKFFDRTFQDFFRKSDDMKRALDYDDGLILFSSNYMNSDHIPKYVFIK